MTYVLVLYYSRHGSTAALAKHIARGVAQGKMEAMIRTVPPVTSTIKPLEQQVPDAGAPYVTLNELEQCSALALGSPTRFGNMAAPMKYFLDGTAELWAKGSLVNKPAAVFTSTGTMHGGMESTLLSMMLPLMHHGMLMCGIPFTVKEINTTLSGGSPYGACHYAGVRHEKDLTSDEITICQALGLRLAQLTKLLNN